jgi:hypothetical protein
MLTYRNRASYRLPLPSKHPILFFQQIYVLNFLTCCIISVFFSLQNAVYFIMLPFLISYNSHPLGTVRPLCRTGTPLPSRHPILYIFSTNIRTEFFKHAARSPYFSLQNAVYLIMLLLLVPVLFAFYIQNVLKFKCQILVPKG